MDRETYMAPSDLPAQRVRTAQAKGWFSTYVAADIAAILDRLGELEAERARYIESTAHWGVRLSCGTFLEFHEDEQTARARAKTYHAMLLRCDVLSTDWREVPADAESGA